VDASGSGRRCRPSRVHARQAAPRAASLHAAPPAGDTARRWGRGPATASAIEPPLAFLGPTENGTSDVPPHRPMARRQRPARPEAFFAGASPHLLEQPPRPGTGW
jgi:hypothetical protein